MNPMVLALLIMGVTILCFIFEPLPLVVVSITASLVYAFTGLIDMNAVFASYGTTTNILMIAMMVIGASLFHSGISELIGSKMASVIGIISFVICALLTLLSYTRMISGDKEEVYQ